MTATSPLQTVREFIASLERKDLEHALSLVSDNCEYDNVPIGKVFGPDGIRAALAGFLANASEVEWVTVREAELGNIVFNERLDRFHFPHGWVEVPVAGVWEVVEGSITLWRDYFDADTFRKQMPQPAGSGSGS
jgi:limonene-1,2-epoxide hydrolase